jgi:hypothetical protein
MGPSLWPKVAIGVVALALLFGGAATLLSRDEPKTERHTIVTNFATPEETFDPVDAQTGEGVVELPEEDFASAADKALKTSAGRFKVMHAILTKEACPPPHIPEPCYVASGSDRYLVMTLAPAGGGTAGLSQVFTTEAHQSSLGFGTGLQAGAYSVSLDTTNNTVRIIYGILSARSAKERVYLYWPKNPTLILPVTE